MVYKNACFGAQLLAVLLPHTFCLSIKVALTHCQDDSCAHDPVYQLITIQSTC
jgi:hypothetical protein